MRTIHFIAGLPRSGSTLLVNLLAQNPRFAVGGTSPLVDMLLLIRQQWDLMPESRAMPEHDSYAGKLRTLKGMIDGYTSGLGPADAVVFDKSRTWLAHLEMAECLLGRRVKVIVPVRDVRDVLASFERLWRKNAATRQIPLEARNYYAFQSAAGRCGVWMAPEGWVGIAYARIRDAITRGFGDRLFFLPYEEFTQYPATWMARIYWFLGEEQNESQGCHKHDYQNVHPETQEDDAAYGFPGLHTIETKVRPARSEWRETFGPSADLIDALYGPLNQFLMPAAGSAHHEGASP